MRNRSEWHIKQDRYFSPENEQLHSYTITNDLNFCGWNTDSGYDGYGLPKELAQWICDILNESGKEPPFIMKSYTWKKNEK